MGWSPLSNARLESPGYLSVPQGCMFPSEFHVTVTKCQIIGSKNVQQITED